MRKRFLGLALVIALVSACATEETINDEVVPYYGIFNKEQENKCVSYTISSWNVVGGVIFSETLIVPGLVLGFWLWKPVGRKKDCHVAP